MVKSSQLNVVIGTHVSFRDCLVICEKSCLGVGRQFVIS